MYTIQIHNKTTSSTITSAGPIADGEEIVKFLGQVSDISLDNCEYLATEFVKLVDGEDTSKHSIPVRFVDGRELTVTAIWEG